MNRINKIEVKQNYDLAGEVIGCAMKVHSILGPGFLESVYQKALAFELKEQGLDVVLEKNISVFYKNQNIGDFIADMIIDDRLIVENKAVQSLVKAHEVQLVHYLTAIGIEEGLLLNFGSKSLEYKKKFRTYKKSLSTHSVNFVNSV